LSFPSSPVNGQTTIANGITYSYSTSTNSWTRAVSGASLVATAVTSTNISGGTAGGILYQTAPGSTGFIPIGGFNTVLISDGSTATWSSLSGISAGASTNADNIQVSTLTPGDRYFTLADVVDGSYIGLESTTINKFNASTGLTIGSTATFTLNTQATSTTTGALKVTGGAGIGGNLYVGGEIVAQKLTIEYTTVTTTLVKTDDVIQTTNNTAASSTTTGAVIVTGGIGIGGGGYFGGSITASSFIGNISSSYITSTGTLQVGYAANILGNGAGNGALHYQSAPNTTAFLGQGSAGWLLVSGGAGVAPAFTSTGSIYVNSAVNANNIIGGAANQIPYQSGVGATAFSSNLTFNGNTLQVNGGTYLNGATTVTNTLVVNSTLNSIGKATIYVPSTNTVTFADNTSTAGLVIAGTGDRVRLQLGVGSNTLGAYGGWIQASFDNTGGVTGTEPLLLNPNGGFVGIGTTSPSQALQVKVATNGNFAVSTPNSGTGARIWVVNDAVSSIQRLEIQGNPVVFPLTTGVDGMYFDASSGNLGLGVTPSAWGPSSSYVALDIGPYAGIAVQTPSGGIEVTANCYGVYSAGSTTWRYKQSYLASRYQQGAGAHAWFNAPSGTAGNAITFTQAMTLDASGNLLVGYTTQQSGAKFAVNGPAYVNSTGTFTGALVVGTAAAGVPGEIRATNEITAYYSDRRLKENVQIIDNAVVKVLSLTGITYTPNALAESYGYDRTKKLAGLFADEVDAVLPEAVRPAPFDDDGTGGSKSGENYQTVQYEKLIPLLVEAIKEQQQQIFQLKKAINSLSSKE
jgi:hypothetical protein